MTPEEARNLKPGDRVCFTSTPGHQGTVVKTYGTTIEIKWDAGTLVPYYQPCMPHIQPAPKKTHD